LTYGRIEGGVRREVLDGLLQRVPDEIAVSCSSASRSATSRRPSSASSLALTVAPFVPAIGQPANPRALAVHQFLSVSPRRVGEPNPPVAAHPSLPVSTTDTVLPPTRSHNPRPIPAFPHPPRRRKATQNPEWPFAAQRGLRLA